MTKAEIKSFVDWHGQRLAALPYSAAIYIELTAARDRWLATVKRK